MRCCVQLNQELCLHKTMLVHHRYSMAVHIRFAYINIRHVPNLGAHMHAFRHLAVHCTHLWQYPLEVLLQTGGFRGAHILPGSHGMAVE